MALAVLRPGFDSRRQRRVLTWLKAYGTYDVHPKSVEIVQLSTATVLLSTATVLLSTATVLISTGDIARYQHGDSTEKALRAAPSCNKVL